MSNIYGIRGDYADTNSVCSDQCANRLDISNQNQVLGQTYVGWAVVLSGQTLEKTRHHSDAATEPDVTVMVDTLIAIDC